MAKSTMKVETGAFRDLVRTLAVGDVFGRVALRFSKDEGNVEVTMKSEDANVVLGLRRSLEGAKDWRVVIEPGALSKILDTKFGSTETLVFQFDPKKPNEPWLLYDDSQPLRQITHYPLDLLEGREVELEWKNLPPREDGRLLLKMKGDDGKLVAGPAPWFVTVKTADLAPAKADYRLHGAEELTLILDEDENLLAIAGRIDEKESVFQSPLSFDENEGEPFEVRVTDRFFGYVERAERVVLQGGAAGGKGKELLAITHTDEDSDLMVVLVSSQRRG